ncbi:hypothetical protein TI04_13405, partial [Achromatium sp. WMS2]
KIVKAAICADVLYHFGYENKPRKTLAQYFAQTLDPIVPVLHKKTNYQTPVATAREDQLEQQIELLKRENQCLRELAQIDTADPMVRWHRIMGQVLARVLPNLNWELHFERNTSVTQLLDILILKRSNSEAITAPLPDGLLPHVDIGMLTYKSHQESLTEWSIQELIGHYVGYRKILSNNDNNNLPAAERFQLYAVTTAFPQALAASMGFSWQATDQLGVYNLILGKLTIIVIVTKQIPKAPHNLPWNLLSQ